SDNSLVIHDDVDTFFLSQSSGLSEDSGSIVSYPNSDVMNSLVATPEISYQDEHERKVPIMPAPVDENETDPPPIFIINNEIFSLHKNSFLLMVVVIVGSNSAKDDEDTGSEKAL
ncbi:22435_t:CDS:2, partial [Entrophospora sp. SA101]